MPPESLLLDAAAVRSLVNCLGRDALMDMLIARLTTAIAEVDPAVVRVPARDGFAYDRPDRGLIEWMPAHFGPAGTTVKVVAYHPSNPERRGIPTIISTICVFESGTGHLLGLIDGTFITAVRTGAASAIASRILAKADSRSLGVIGCGAQAVTQIHALTRAFALERVMAYDIREDIASSLVRRMAFLGLDVDVVPRSALAAMLERVDILCTCTSAAPGEGPVIGDFTNRPHLHINAVGSDFPGKIELPATLLRRALVCPDFREQAIREGECQQLQDAEIGPELTTLVKEAASYESARTSLTVFDSTGWALEDHVAASLMFDCARQLGIGRRVAVECLPPDPRDPYSLLNAAEAVSAFSVAAGFPAS